MDFVNDGLVEADLAEERQLQEKRSDDDAIELVVVQNMPDGGRFRSVKHRNVGGEVSGAAALPEIQKMAVDSRGEQSLMP
ncbi:hypothetical protein D9M72_612770 [compost metagenome]